jgi:hypothetical protein
MNQPSKRDPRVMRSGSRDGVVGEETSMVEDDFGPWDD